MKVDHDYLKNMLEKMEGINAPIFNINDLKNAGLNYDDDNFIFHMAILSDYGLIERDDREAGFGLFRGSDGYVSWAAIPLRLTAQGHQFIEALHNKEVWTTIKKEFRDAGIKTLWDVSKSLLEGFAKKRVEELLK